MAKTDEDMWLEWDDKEREEALSSPFFVYWQEVKRLVENQEREEPDG